MEIDKSFIVWAEKVLGEKCVATKEVYGDQSNVYRLETSKGNYFLKIGSGLGKECDRLEWLRGRLPVPKVVGFEISSDKDALLLSVIEGANLATLKEEWSVEKIVDQLVAAIKKFHAVDTKDCPFGIPGPGKVLVHGDACLPNFIFQSDNFSGYIDLGDMAVDSSEVDFAAAIWSLQYNLGPGHGLEFLEKYGVQGATEKLVEKLRLQYETMRKKSGLS